MDQRGPCCPGLGPGETGFLANRPETPGGKKRPRRALLQPGVVVKLRVYSVGRSLRSSLARESGGTHVTLPTRSFTANPVGAGNSTRWAVWLGRYALEKESRAPKARLTRVMVEVEND